MSTVYTFSSKVLKNTSTDKWLTKKEGPIIIQPNESPNASTHNSSSKYYCPMKSQYGEVKVDLTTTYIINYPSSNIKSIEVMRVDSNMTYYGVNTYNQPSGIITIKFGDYINSSDWNNTNEIRFILYDNNDNIVYEPVTLTPVS